MWSEAEGQYCCNRRIDSGHGICLNISVTAAGDYGIESPIILKGRIPQTDYFPQLRGTNEKKEKGDFTVILPESCPCRGDFSRFYNTRETFPDTRIRAVNLRSQSPLRDI